MDTRKKSKYNEQYVLDIKVKNLSNVPIKSVKLDSIDSLAIHIF